MLILIYHSMAMIIAFILIVAGFRVWQLFATNNGSPVDKEGPRRLRRNAAGSLAAILIITGVIGASIKSVQGWRWVDRKVGDAVGSSRLGDQSDRIPDRAASAVKSAIAKRYFSDEEAETVHEWMYQEGLVADGILIEPVDTFQASVPLSAFYKVLNDVQLTDTDKIRLLDWLAFPPDEEEIPTYLGRLVRKAVQGVQLDLIEKRQINALVDGGDQSGEDDPWDSGGEAAPMPPDPMSEEPPPSPQSEEDMTEAGI